MIKIGILISGPPRYAKKSPVHMDIRIPARGYQHSDYTSVDLRQVGIGILKGDDTVHTSWLFQC